MAWLVVAWAASALVLLAALAVAERRHTLRAVSHAWRHDLA